jgi:hypothetical protein
MTKENHDDYTAMIEYEFKSLLSSSDLFLGRTLGSRNKDSPCVATLHIIS